jgi:single-strand DNA-binding protein
MATQQMSVTMTGFAATHPVRHPSVARLVTFRMASTPRWNDGGEWRDGGTLFIDVQCWGKLGDHVMQSVVKGAPLVIAGRMTSYTFTPENSARTGQDGKPFKETIWRVTAGNVGLDLSHSPSSWSLRGRVKDTTADGEGPAAEETENRAASGPWPRAVGAPRPPLPSRGTPPGGPGTPGTLPGLVSRSTSTPRSGRGSGNRSEPWCP